MVLTIAIILILHLCSKIECGYKEVPVKTYTIENIQHPLDNLDDVVEYYEQKRAGYFDL